MKNDTFREMLHMVEEMTFSFYGHNICTVNGEWRSINVKVAGKLKSIRYEK